MSYRYIRNKPERRVLRLSTPRKKNKGENLIAWKKKKKDSPVPLEAPLTYSSIVEVKQETPDEEETLDIVAQDSESGVLEQEEEPESIPLDIPVVPNLDLVKKSTTSTDIVESSSTFTSRACIGSTEPPLAKRPNLSLNSPTSNTEIKDEFSVFGDFVADKIRSFTDRDLQIEAHHHITNLLLEMERKILNEGSLPVISEISCVPKPLPVTLTLPFTSKISGNSSVQTQLPPSSSISKISSLQTQMPATVTLPSSSVIQFLNLQTPLPAAATLPSSTAVSRNSSVQNQLPFSSGISVNSVLHIPPGTVPLPSSSTISRITNLQNELCTSVTLPSSTNVSGNPSFQTALPATMMLPSSLAISVVSGLGTPLSSTVSLPPSSIIPITTTNTIFLNTQFVRPSVQKF